MAWSPETQALLKACKPRERTFVRQLLLDPRHIAVKAFKACGYRYGSEDSARSMASLLLRRPRVTALFEAMLNEQVQKSHVSDADIVNKLTEIAFADPREMFDADGKRLEIHEMSREVASTIASVEFDRTKTTRGDEVLTEESVVKVRTLDRLAALKTLAQVKGMLNTKVEHSGTVNWEKVVAAAAASQEG